MNETNLPLQRQRRRVVWFLDGELVHKIAEEDKEFHLGEVLTEAVTSTDAKWYQLIWLDCLAVFIQESLGLELVWILPNGGVFENRPEVGYE